MCMEEFDDEVVVDMWKALGTGLGKCSIKNFVGCLDKLRFLKARLCGFYALDAMQWFKQVLIDLVAWAKLSNLPVAYIDLSDNVFVDNYASWSDPSTRMSDIASLKEQWIFPLIFKTVLSTH